ncbi:MAG: MBOAT family protein [Oscillospiraceae bacterium]|nr:MBOAT family protein [Oscillospiraceae bacterium]
MEFSNLYFLYILLPLTMLVYFLMPDIKRKNIALLVIGLLFYAMGQPIYLGLLAGLSYLNYYLALRIRPRKRATVILPVAINIAVLALFKYLDFFLGMVGLGSEDGLLLSMVKGMVNGLNSIGFSFAEPKSVLPIGISFYTFSVISYLLDVYWGKVKAEKSFVNLLLYLTMFPKMLQGPIVRYEQVAAQLTQRKSHPRMIFEGALRFTVGLAKKVLLADYCGKVISELAAVGSDTTLIGAWLSAIMFMFQIYFDFSGYSDMAIGLGKIFGFRYCENFNLPYTSASITEFWRRWHMSLGSFFRDYVYIPLGGNRKGMVRQIINLLVVWALTGLWHGASWNYVLWGLYFFIILVAEKQMMKQLEELPKLLRQVLTNLLVIFGWVLFAHEDFGELGKAMGAMFGFGGFAGSGVGTKLLNSLPLILLCWLGSTSLPQAAARIWSGICGMNGKQRRSNRITVMKAVYVISVFGFMCLLLWLCTVSLVGNTSAPSIYGNF